MLTLEKFEEASEIVKNVTLETKLMYSEYLSRQTGAKVYLKPENMQFTGAYKVRGAYYKISTLSEEERKKGLITASAGNHAQGVAYAASRFGAKAVIVMPTSTPLMKVNRTKSYGAEVVLYGDVYDEACAHAYQLAEEHGYTFIHPFDDEAVATGQGTIAMEIIKELPLVDYILVPIGGGGLISGVACAIKSINPNCKEYGVQAAGAPSMKQSIEHKKIEKLASVSTMADGIAVKEPGTLTFEACMKYVDGIVTVTEAEIASAILMLLEKHKMVAEGAGAVSVAAAMTNKVDIKGKNVLCVVSGGNVDVNVLDRIIDKGLQENGRIAEFSVMMADKPGQLIQLLQIIAQTGANILDVNHDRRAKGVAVSNVVVNVTVETRNKAHYEEMVAALKAQGYTI